MSNPPIIDDFDNEDERDLVQMFYNQDYSEEFKGKVPNGHDRLKIVQAAGWVPGSLLQRAEHARDIAEQELVRIREELNNMSEEIKDVQEQLRERRGDVKPTSGGKVTGGKIKSMSIVTPKDPTAPTVAEMSSGAPIHFGGSVELTLDIDEDAQLDELIYGSRITRPPNMSISINRDSTHS